MTRSPRLSLRARLLAGLIVVTAPTTGARAPLSHGA
jgi:hypothetical protein